MAAEAGAEVWAEKLRLPLFVAMGVWAADQATKLAIRRSLALGAQLTLVDGLLSIVHARNPGAAFSFLATAPDWFRGPFFIVVTAAAIVAIVIVVARTTPDESLTRLALGGVLGGALGNLTDRLLYGEVIDFLDVHWGMHHWPAFNVADSAISLCVGTIFVHGIFSGRRQLSPGLSRRAPEP